MISTLLLALVPAAEPLPSYRAEPTPALSAQQRIEQLADETSSAPQHGSQRIAALPAQQRIEQLAQERYSAQKNGAVETQRMLERVGQPFRDILHLNERTREQIEQRELANRMAATAVGFTSLSLGSWHGLQHGVAKALEGGVLMDEIGHALGHGGQPASELDVADRFDTRTASGEDLHALNPDGRFAWIGYRFRFRWEQGCLGHRCTLPLLYGPFSRRFS